MKRRVLVGAIALAVAFAAIPTHMVCAEMPADTSTASAAIDQGGSIAEEITPSADGCVIDSPGIYHVLAGSSDASTDRSIITVTTTDPVLIKFVGDVSFNSSRPLIDVCENGDVSIGAAGYSVVNTGSGNESNVVMCRQGSTVKVEGGTFQASGEAAVLYGYGRREIKLYVGEGTTVKSAGVGEQAGPTILMSNGSVYLLGGTFDNGVSTREAVRARAVNMSGGTITAQSKQGVGISGTSVTMTGGTIENFGKGIEPIGGGSKIKVGGTASFGNVDNDVWLIKGMKFELADDFTGKLSVGTADEIAAGDRRQITQEGTPFAMLDHVTAANSACTVGYDPNGQFLYLTGIPQSAGDSEGDNGGAAASGDQNPSALTPAGETPVASAPSATMPAPAKAAATGKASGPLAATGDASDPVLCAGIAAGGLALIAAGIIIADCKKKRNR